MSIFGVFAVYRWLLFVRLHIHKTHAPRVHTENIHFEFGKVVEINWKQNLLFCETRISMASGGGSLCERQVFYRHVKRVRSSHT